MIDLEVGPYRVLSLLGSGGMATVYRARVLRAVHGLDPGQEIALKLMHPHHFEKPGYLQRFLREAKIGLSIRHPNVVSTYEVGVASVQGSPRQYLAMEYVEGRTLQALLAELTLVPEELCRRIGRAITRGLVAIHGAGAVHRDLKLDNVMITSHQDVKVMDLGVARLVDETRGFSNTGLFIGTLRYAAPEQFTVTSDALDGRTDFYSLGVILYELATGRLPHPDEDWRVFLRKLLVEPPPRARELNPRLSGFFEALVHRLLAKDRESRFDSARELLAILDAGETSTWWQDQEIRLEQEPPRVPLRRLPMSRETDLHGREEVIERLRSRFEEASKGNGRVVLIEGEAGIGKSRLVDDVATRLADRQPLHFLFGSYPSGGAATSAGAFTSALVEHLGADSLEETLRSRLSAAPLLVEPFAAFLRGEPTPPGAVPLTRESLQTAFVLVVRSIARERTTILLIDDVHFAPEEGRGLFAALASAVPGHPILLIGTARLGLPEAWRSAIAGLTHAETMELGRLSPAALLALLTESLGSEAAARDILPGIVERSDGNPFFVFEILRELRSRGVRAPLDKRNVASSVHAVQIPSSVTELIRARMAGLDRLDHDILDIASCCGFEFDPFLVAQVLDLGVIRLLRRLAHLEGDQHLVRSTGLGYVFDHHLVQEQLYGDLSDLQRREYHAALGTALEDKEKALDSAPGTMKGAVVTQLADHFLRGARDDKALRYLDAALQHLSRGHQAHAAVELADRALAAPGLLRDRERLEVLTRKAEELSLLGPHPDEGTTLEEARVLADAVGEAPQRVRIRVALGTYLFRTGSSPQARARYSEALQIAQDSGDVALEATPRGSLGMLALDEGNYEDAQRQLELHLELARRLDDQKEVALASECLGNLHFRLGRYEEARRCLEEELRLARGLGYVRGEAFTAAGLTAVLTSLGELASALENGKRSVELSRQIGYRGGEAYALGNLGRVLGYLGDRKPAQETYAAGLAIAGEIRGKRWEANLLTGLGVVTEEDNPIEAEELYRKAITLGRELENRYGMASDLLHLGGLLARMDRPDEARTCLEEAFAIGVHLQVVNVPPLALARLAVLTGCSSDPRWAAYDADDPRLAIRARMEAHYLRWQATHASVHLESARALLARLRERAPAEYRDRMITEVQLHREIWSGLPLEPPAGG